jgi:hypothetical protein
MNAGPAWGIIMPRNSPHSAVRALAFVLAAGLSCAHRTAASGQESREIVASFLQRHCFKCHGEKKQEAEFDLHTLDANVAGGKDIDRWKAVAERLALDEMPPPTEPRPDARALITVRNWLKEELAKGGESIADVEAKLLLPGQGNRVDHDALFSGVITGPAASPTRLWRFSPQIYSALMPRITGRRPAARGTGLHLAQPFSTSSADGFKDFAALFVIDEPTVVQLMRNAQLAVEFEPGLSGAIKPLIAPGHEPTEAEKRAAVSRQFELVLFREPTEDELERFVELMEKNIKAAGPSIGVKTTLAAVLLLPEAVYRFERGEGDADEFGRRMLSPRELAYGLAFALTDARPDADLLSAVTDGKLKTRDDVRRQVDRLLSDKSIDKPRIMRFFEEYFEFTAAADVFKDFEPPILKKAWQPEVLVNDTRHLINYILDRDQDVLRELLTTNKSFVNYQIGTNGEPLPAWKHPKNNPAKKDEHPEIGHWYGLPADWEWTAEQPLEFAPDEQVGILTQPSWLAAFATNNENHAIRRGKWIRERLLGGVIPDVPINVDAKLPEAPERTLRERMEVTRQDYCWKCHRQMNPLGLPLERYDYLGRFRNRELDQPVVTTGSIEYCGEAALDGDVSNVAELMGKLADSPRVRQVFVRHAFRYWMGRNETLSDSPTLIAADKAYVDSGGSMKALITSLLTSDSFLYRFDSSQTNTRAE